MFVLIFGNVFEVMICMEVLFGNWFVVLWLYDLIVVLGGWFLVFVGSFEGEVEEMINSVIFSGVVMEWFVLMIVELGGLFDMYVDW